MNGKLDKVYNFIHMLCEVRVGEQKTTAKKKKNNAADISLLVAGAHIHKNLFFIIKFNSHPPSVTRNQFVT